MSIGNEFLQSAIKRLKSYKDLGDKTFAQLADDDFHYQPNEASNSIAVIIQHMAGNMLSRWTDFLTTDGEKEWRRRDDEFENDIQSRDEMIKTWNQGWDCLFSTLDELDNNDLSKEITIRQQSHSVMDAINRQLTHYAYHVGQIVYIGKMIRNESWTSLSIPRGKSNEFNTNFTAKK